MSELWKEFHIKALKNKGGDEKAYLLLFASKIPRYTKGCKCREFWVNYIRLHPPVYGANGELFEWSVTCHNAVNKKLNKPTMTVDVARKIYEKLL